MVRMPVYSGSLIEWIWFPLEPPVQGRKHDTAQAGDLLFQIVATLGSLIKQPNVGLTSG